MNTTVRIYVTIATIICSTQLRFMESLHDFDAVHWDHEPVVNWRLLIAQGACPPSSISNPQSTIFNRSGHDAGKGSGRVTFMESPFGLVPCIGTMNPTVRIYVTIATIICSTQPRFMESPLPLLRMHRDHEPTPSPSKEGSRTV